MASNQHGQGSAEFQRKFGNRRLIYMGNHPLLEYERKWGLGRGTLLGRRRGRAAKRTAQQQIAAAATTTSRRVKRAKQQPQRPPTPGDSSSSSYSSSPERSPAAESNQEDDDEDEDSGIVDTRPENLFEDEEPLFENESFKVRNIFLSRKVKAAVKSEKGTK